MPLRRQPVSATRIGAVLLIVGAVALLQSPPPCWCVALAGQSDAVTAPDSISLLRCDDGREIVWLGRAAPDHLLCATTDGRQLTIHEVEGKSVSLVASTDNPEIRDVRGIIRHPDGYWVAASQGLWLLSDGGGLVKYAAVNCRSWWQFGSLGQEHSWEDTIAGVGATVPLDGGAFYAALRLGSEDLSTHVRDMWPDGPAVLGRVELRDGRVLLQAVRPARSEQAMTFEHNTLWFAAPHLDIGGCRSGDLSARRVTRLPIGEGEGWWRAPDLFPRVHVSGGPREPAALAFDPDGYPWVGLHDPEKQINTVYWWHLENGWVEDMQLAAMLGEERVSSVIAVTRNSVYVCGADGTLLVGHGGAWERVEYRQETGRAPVTGLGRAVLDDEGLVVTDGRTVYRLDVDDI